MKGSTPYLPRLETSLGKPARQRAYRYGIIFFLSFLSTQETFWDNRQNILRTLRECRVKVATCSDYSSQREEAARKSFLYLWLTAFR